MIMGSRQLICCCFLIVAGFAISSHAHTTSGISVQRNEVHWNKKGVAGKCRAGKHGLKCSQCPKGYYSTDGVHCQRCTNSKTTGDCENGCTSPSQCTEVGCPVGTYKPSSSSDCEPCPVGQYSEGGFPFHKRCEHCPAGTTTPGRGSYSLEQCVHKVCPAGTTRAPGGVECVPCALGTYSVEGAEVCTMCGQGMTTPEVGASDVDQCICDAGMEPSEGDEATCVKCKLGTFKPHNGNQACDTCPWPKVTLKPGSTSPAACVCPVGSGSGPDCDDCPDNMIQLEDGTCGCPAGTGGPNCEECKANSYSIEGGPGNPRPKCKPCGLHFTSPAGSISAEYCECAAGYGADSEDDRRCIPCPLGTFNPGTKSLRGGAAKVAATGRLTAAQVAIAAIPAKKQRVADKPLASPCQRCGAAHLGGKFTTLQTGSTSAELCACMPGFGGSSCSACPAGTYSEGGTHAVCKSCPARGAGYTTNPISAATSMASCVCLPGYGVSEGGVCRLCPVNTYSEGGTKEECQPCPFGSTSPAGSTELDSCVMVAQECPIGQTAPPEAVSLEQCACLPGYGGGKTPQDACSICPVGTFAPGGNTQPCQPCKFGYTSPAGSTSEEQCYKVSQACPAGTQAPKGREIASTAECVCQAGHGISSTAPATSSSSGRTCSLCPAGTFSKGGRLQECRPCPFGTTSHIGASALEACVYSPQACPIGQWAPEGSMTKDQCICYPGFGGGETSSDPCTICPAGTYSLGKTLDKCIPCDFGMTSPVGSTSRDACYPAKHCPAGTRVPPSKYRPGYASSKNECKCKPGYGSTTGEGMCKLCPVSTYAPGGNMEDCKPCPFGTTSAAGSTDRSDCRPEAQKCPVGQIAPHDAVSADECRCLPGYGGGATSSDACHICPAGSWSPGGSTQPCTPCGFGYSSPEGSTSEEACYTTNACPSGTEPHRGIETPSGLQDCVCKRGYGSPTGAGICRPCPAGTYGPGGNMEECKPCPFGTTSGEGATSKSQCKLVPQACPIGQWAPMDAVSKAECRCYKGHGGGQHPSDPCHICPVGTFSANKGTAECVPCRFGFTSPEGAEDESDCYPIDSCPAGTVIPGHTAGASAQECRCKPGHGSLTGSGSCRLCPVGTFSPGGTMEDCQPCPFGTSSKAGAESSFDCVPVAQKCPPGQIAAPGAESREQCGCLPGYGGGETPHSACHICPAGSWSPGGTTQPCIPCGFGYSSTEGATAGAACIPVNSCPAGTDYRQHDPEKAFTQADCVCKPGYGSPTGSGICRLCPAGTFSEGGSMEDCRPCAFGMTSSDGAGRCTRAVEQACPIGQWAPADAISRDECRCYKGFGGGHRPSDPCHICPAGTFSANKGTERCVPCPFGYTSPEGAHNDDQCFAVDVCPAGTGVPPGQELYDIVQCKCRPGFGSTTGSAPCHLCPIGTFSKGGSMEACMPCPFGMTSKAGAWRIDDCVASAQPCPVGQIAPPGAVSPAECGCLPGFGSGDKATDPCHICPPGSWSPGGHSQPCKPCGFGYTGPEGASTHEQCHAVNACPAGTVLSAGGSGTGDCVCQPGHGTIMGSGPCKICPAGTFAHGGTLEECTPCGFGFTSAEGSDSRQDCRPVSQACPLGQWAAADAVSPEQCRCYRGFGGGARREEPCTLCPAGSFSANSGTERCSLCPPGTTSLEGAGDEAECFPADWDCPAGTARLLTPNGRPSRSCKCKAGYGSVTGWAPCRLCPVGSYSQGRTMEDCSPCPFGFTSRAGARSADDCVPESQPCPIGQIAPPNAESADQCFCLPGYGGGATPKDPCRVCPPGSWSPGGSTQPCIACGFGYTSTEGAWSDKQCVATNACPAGTEYGTSLDAVFSIRDCVCQPGHGSATGTGVCRLCTAGTYSRGGSMEECMSCPEGMASREGASSDRDCYKRAYPKVPHEDEALNLMSQKDTKVTTQQQTKAQTQQQQQQQTRVQPQQQQQTKAQPQQQQQQPQQRKGSGDAGANAHQGTSWHSRSGKPVPIAAAHPHNNPMGDVMAAASASAEPATTAHEDQLPAAAQKPQQPAHAPAAGQGPQQKQQQQQQQQQKQSPSGPVSGQTLPQSASAGSQASKQEQKVQTADTNQQSSTIDTDAGQVPKQQQQQPPAAAGTGDQAHKGDVSAAAAAAAAGAAVGRSPQPPPQQQQGAAAQTPPTQQAGAATAKPSQGQHQGQQQAPAPDKPSQQGTAGSTRNHQPVPDAVRPTQQTQGQPNSTQHSTADFKTPGPTAAAGSSPQHGTAATQPAQKVDGIGSDADKLPSNKPAAAEPPQPQQKAAGDTAATKQQEGQMPRSSSVQQQQPAAASNGSTTATKGTSAVSGSQGSSSSSSSNVQTPAGAAAAAPPQQVPSAAGPGAQANATSSSSSSGVAPATKQATDAPAQPAQAHESQQADDMTAEAQELSSWDQEEPLEEEEEEAEQQTEQELEL